MKLFNSGKKGQIKRLPVRQGVEIQRLAFDYAQADISTNSSKTIFLD